MKQVMHYINKIYQLNTVISQLVDTTAVILITFSIVGLAGVLNDDTPLTQQLVVLILTGYAFKFFFALLDTVPFYFMTAWLSRYLEIDPNQEHTVLEGEGTDSHPTRP